MAKKNQTKTEEAQPAKGAFILTTPLIDDDKYVKNGEKKYYEVKSDVSHFDANRLADLIKKGVVVEVGAEPEEENSGEGNDEEQ